MSKTPRPRTGAPHRRWVPSTGGSGSSPVAARQPPPVISSRADRLRPRTPIRAGTPAVWSSLQLLLQLVEEAPVGGLGDDLLRARLDHPGLVEAQGVKPDRVFGVVVPPRGVRYLLHRLEGVGVVVPFVGHQPSGPVGLNGTEVGRLQDRAERPLGRHRVLADKL